MPRFARKVWHSFGLLLDLSPRPGAQNRLARMRVELSTRQDRKMLAADFYRVGRDIKTAMEKQHG